MKKKCFSNLYKKGLLFGNESFRTDSSSPACASLSPPAKDESLEGGHTSEEGDRDRDRICSPTRSPETPGFRRKSFYLHHFTAKARNMKAFSSTFSTTILFLDPMIFFSEQNHKLLFGIEPNETEHIQI